MKDFFVSYTSNDISYATWVAEILEKNGYSVTIQAWDFKVGDNFVAKINEALIECEKMIIILSENYLKSEWCEEEWTSKLLEQVKKQNRLLFPIRIEPVELKGLLAKIVHIDIVDMSEEDATKTIIDKVSSKYERKSEEGYPSYYNIEHLFIDTDYFVEDASITYIKTCKSRVLKDGLTKLHNRITWFADENIELSSLTSGVTIELLDLRDTNLNYNIVFDQKFNKYDEIEFRVKAILTNNNKHFDNFFSTEVITPIENLSVHLSLADSSVHKVYTQKISNSPMNIRTEQPKEHSFTSPFHWHISRPELNFEYKVYW